MGGRELGVGGRVTVGVDKGTVARSALSGREEARSRCLYMKRGKYDESGGVVW